MLGRKKIWTFGLLAIACLLTGSAMAATHTLTFDAVPDVACGEIWNENGLNCYFGETDSWDMTYPYCYIFNVNMEHEGNIGPYYGPAQLVIDLTNIQMVESIEADVYETIAGGLRMFLYDWDGELVDNDQTYSEDHLTLGLTPGIGTPVSKLVISSHEGAVWEVRFNGDSIVGAESSMTFGALKALYR